MVNGEASFHLHSIGADTATRPPLPGDAQADICIVGAGYTGLWTAWWLRQSLPDRSILVVEAERVGFGASGRNLGWLSGKPIGDRRRLAEGPAGPAGPITLRRACIEALDAIPALMRENGIDIEARRVGYLHIAQTPAELARVRQSVADRASWGLGEEDLALLTPEQVTERVRIEGVLGGAYSPHCVRIQPAKLAIGLARMVEARGVVILEGTRVTRIRPGLVETDRGTIRAPVVLRATEAYSPALPGHARSILPVRSNVLATEPLSPAQWDAIGWKGGEGLFGAAHAAYFLTQTADGRILIAGRGFPYRYGSRFDDNGRLSPGTIRLLERGLTELFPGIGLRAAHAWCGLFGIPRDWAPSVSFDPAAGLGSAGGYAGQGVAGAYLAGHTLADLVAGHDTAWTRLPWTQRSSPDWEPEPLRWAGARATFHLYRMADRLERRSRAPATSRLATFANSISGRP